jgi:hypothetical protein
MASTLDHPWFSDPDMSEGCRSLREDLKSVEQMLNGDDPPTWVIILDQFVRFWRSRTRIVIHDDATIDFEGELPAKSRHLSENERVRLVDLLGRATPDTIASLKNTVIDGHQCGLTVVHGSPRWLAFADFNLCGIPATESDSIALRLTNEIIADLGVWQYTSIDNLGNRMISGRSDL